MALNTNLVAYYKLEDATDSITGGTTLSNINAVAFVAAKIGNGGDFELGDASHFSLTNANSSQLGFVTDFSVAVWLKPESLPSLDTIFYITSRRAGGNGYSILFEDAATVKQWRVI